MRKPRPTKVYRVETYDTPPDTYLNSTSQYLNKPRWWPGPGERIKDIGGREVRVVYLEGTITWGDR